MRFGAKLRSGLVALAVPWLIGAPALTAQDGQPKATDPPREPRAMLEARLARLDSTLQSTDATAEAREHARLEAEVIRHRLRSGDFQAGDRVLLRVESDTLLSGTFTVREGPLLELPGIGPISLSGVLRSELNSFLTEQLAKYLRNPRVNARALVRLSVTGEVERPGFYAVPTDAVLADVLMLAGGPTQEAKASDLRLERSGREILEGDALQRLVAEGRTIEELQLQSGDRLVVPRLTRWDPDMTVRVLGFVIGLPVAIWGITQLFGGGN